LVFLRVFWSFDRSSDILLKINKIHFKLRETLDTGSCLGYPAGPESVTLDQLERWLFWGFLFCHSVVEVSKIEGGEYQVTILPTYSTYQDF
jgi:hypothetical protein